MDFTAILKNLAPMLATTLAAPAGPLAPLAGMAVSAVMGAVAPEQSAAIDSARSEGGVQAAIAKIGELFQQGAINTAQIKQAELAHAEKMRELGYKNAADLEKIAADDRANARGMQTSTRSWVPAALAVAVTLGFFGVLAAMMLGTIKSPNNDALLLMLGSLGTAWGAIISFYFGSSASSKDKDATLAEIAKAP